MRKIKMAMIRQRRVSNDIKDGVYENEEQFDMTERYNKSLKVAEEERNVQMSTASTKVSTTKHRAYIEMRN